MTQLWSILISGVVLVLTAAAILALTRDKARASAVGLLVGTVCGLVAAFIIVQPRLDIVPDTLEPVGAGVIIVLVSLGLIWLTWRRWMQD